MSEYMEYTKGGEILIAPSLECKHQYLFKCDLCDKFFGDFQLFFTHYLRHYDMDSGEEDDNNSSVPSETELHQDLYENIMADGEDYEDKYEISQSAYENTGDEFVQDHEDTTGTSCSEDVEWENKSTSFKDETSIHGSEEDCVLIEIAHPNQDELNDIKPEMKNEKLEDYPTGDEEEEAKRKDEEEKYNKEFLKTFMKSRENVSALIAEYKMQSHLWDFNEPVEYRHIEKRTMTWSDIALNLYEAKNIEISPDQVAACIVYLRQRYREKKKKLEDKLDNDSESLPMWVFRKLNFLNPFVESNPIGILDVHQDLAPEQTVQILKIYERCTHLWDSNTFEFYCNNGRNVALNKMKDIIMREMNLEVDTSSLQSYIRSVCEYYTTEKRRQRTHPNKETAAKYYKHLQFLQEHVGPLQCSYCQSTFQNQLRLKLHESHHTRTMPFKCPECKKEFNNVETYIYHMKRHMGDLNHECKLCGKRFIRTIEVKDHMRSHTGDKPFCCEICGASFGQRTGFGRHMKIHLKKYISFCPYCSKGFYTKDGMMKHKVVHTNIRDFVCSICGKAFKTKRTLRSHVAVHEDGNYACDICGKSAFKNKINLRQHKRKHRLKNENKTD